MEIFPVKEQTVPFCQWRNLFRIKFQIKIPISGENYSDTIFGEDSFIFIRIDQRREEFFTLLPFIDQEQLRGRHT